MRIAAVGAAAVATAVLAASCGGASHGSPPTVTVLTSTVPSSLDPAVAFGPRALEADWLAYTPLITFAHAHGVTGTRLIPGLATDLPTITAGGTTYGFTLRPGLVYASGQPVRASDFAWAVERAVKLGWPGARTFIIGRVAGADAFAAGRASTISGISADDRSGRITIRLIAPYGQFDDVLALPALAPVPRSTPLRDERSVPPAGVGPYRIAAVLPGRSFSLLPSARWAAAGIPGIPAGRLAIRVKASPDPATSVRAVAAGRADALDPWDPIPARALARVRSGGRATVVTTAAAATYALLMSAARRPFSSPLAREAVAAGLDRAALSGLTPGCYLLPPPIAGHSSAPCPLAGDIVRARALVARSGLGGARVAVWSRAAPRALASYCVSLLERIGFTVVPAASSATATARIAVAEPALPNPVAVYERLPEIAAEPHVASQLHLLAVVPAGQLTAVAELWKALDGYTTRRAYTAVLGYPNMTTVVSARVEPGSVILQPVAGLDWSALALR